jgi:ubiquinone/menaquinone biosynthesis C-methylase UbiE
MGDTRSISTGAKSSNKGARGVTKRLDALARLTPLSGDRLLDIGCGDGTYTIPLTTGWRGGPAGFVRTDAVDIEPQRLKDFEERLVGSSPASSITVHNMSADDLAFPDDTFDAVTAIEVMEHVGDVDAVLAEIHRVLLPGGRFLLTTPNRWFPFETHGPVIGGKRRKIWTAPGLPWIKPLHRHWSDARAFTATELTTQARTAGLHLLANDYMMPPFDANPVGKRLRRVTDAIEHSRLKFFGMALVMVFEKPAVP